jgi:CheY-like chemotaxis protein
LYPRQQDELDNSPFNRLRPDVITTDLTLLDCTGVSLCAQLKKDEITKDIPVIAVTGRAMPDEVAYALASGCVAVLVKPCLPAELLSEIKRVLRVPSLHCPSYSTPF